MDDVNSNEWISSKQAYQPTIKKLYEPQVDRLVSQVVGKQVMASDPRLIKKVLEWKSKKDPEQTDNFLKDPKKVSELRELFK